MTEEDEKRMRESDRNYTEPAALALDRRMLLAEIDRLRAENLHYLENVAVLVKERGSLKAALAEAGKVLMQLRRLVGPSSSLVAHDATMILDAYFAERDKL